MDVLDSMSTNTHSQNMHGFFLSKSSLDFQPAFVGFFLSCLLRFFLLTFLFQTPPSSKTNPFHLFSLSLFSSSAP